MLEVGFGKHYQVKLVFALCVCVLLGMNYLSEKSGRSPFGASLVTAVDIASSFYGLHFLFKKWMQCFGVVILSR